MGGFVRTMRRPACRVQDPSYSWQRHLSLITTAFANRNIQFTEPSFRCCWTLSAFSHVLGGRPDGCGCELDPDDVQSIFLALSTVSGAVLGSVIPSTGAAALAAIGIYTRLRRSRPHRSEAHPAREIRNCYLLHEISARVGHEDMHPFPS